PRPDLFSTAKVLCSMKSPGSVVQVGRVAFELSRFEVVGDSCQVEGRWFGVRGRRFMRPALLVSVDGQPTRLLADLADKPWAAEDGEPWKASFPYAVESGRPAEAELTVTPDLTITLPAPKPLAAGAREKSTSRRGDGSRRPGLRRTDGGSDSGAAAAADRPDRRRRRARSPAAGNERGTADPLMSELGDLRDTQRRLRQRLDRAEADKARTVERLNEVSSALREATHEREESNTTRDRTAAE